MVDFSVILNEHLVRREYSLKEQPPQMEVCAQEARSKSVHKLALKLLSLLFTNGRGLMHPTRGKEALESANNKGFAKRSCSIQFSAISENCMHEPISEQLFDTVQEHNPILNQISLYHLWISTMQGEGCTLWLSVCDKLNMWKSDCLPLHCGCFYSSASTTDIQ